jgi:membrane dipeptidase
MTAPLIDNLQYANWSPEIFGQLRAGGVDAIHVTVAYHETFAELVGNLARWNRHFEDHPDLLLRGLEARDISRAQESGRTAVFFGLQTPGPIGDDLGLIEICHQLGIRFMQLTYNNQSLLATGHAEAQDAGLTRFGREAVAEMNRVGLAIDMSHAAERSTREAIDASARPVAITHANPHWWHPVPRNPSDAVLRALTGRGGVLGFSLYPHHLRGGSDCRLEAFCAMIAEAADRYGVDHLGIGSDLCQNQPDSVVHWMRTGRWYKPADDAEPARFPAMPCWFRDNRDWENIRAGLQKAGLAAAEVDGILGGNWLRFYETSFGPVP